MYTKQVSVFLENRRGRLAEVTQLLADDGIDIRALSMGDMLDFGVLRMVVNDANRCLGILRAHHFVAQETDVVAVEMEDRPGGLHRIIKPLDREGINIEYLYAFCEKSSDKAIVVFKMDDAARAVEVLNKAGISVVPDSKIQSL